MKYVESFCWSMQNIGRAFMKWRLQGAGLSAETSGSTLSWAATPPVRMSRHQQYIAKLQLTDFPAFMVWMFPYSSFPRHIEASWQGLFYSVKPENCKHNPPSPPPFFNNCYKKNKHLFATKTDVLLCVPEDANCSERAE